jgi:hypothetical protein
MNDTLWWDDLDGDSLVCRPGYESAQQFEIACFVVTRLAPSIMVVCGVLLIHLACISIIAEKKTKVRPIPSGVSRRLLYAVNPSRKRNCFKMELRLSKHGSSLALVLSAITLSISGTFLLNGHGTIYASNTIQGVIGDACREYVLRILNINHYLSC